MIPGSEELHEDLRRVAREVLEAERPAWRGSPSEADRAAAWRRYAELGWLGLEVPERLGGSGATFAEVAVVLEEMGRVLNAAPYLGSVLGVGLLNRLEPSPACDELLGRIAAGESKVAVAVAPGERAPDAAFRVERRAGALVLHGEAAYVPDLEPAGTLLLAIRDPAGCPVVAAVQPRDRGVHIVDQPVLDSTRRLGLIRVEGYEVDEASLWGFVGEPEWSTREVADRGALALACDSLGLSAAMMDATVDYACVRRQFDRPIGSFQAVKHACADMLVEVSIGRQLCRLAVQQTVASDPDAGLAVSRAKSHVGARGVDIAGKAMQLHGGIGYTWESGIHAYLKRAALNRTLFGSTRAHRRRLADRFTRSAA
jgi:alkylation response protein AidB-like acyl-CoA dehydrogenase